MGWVPAVAIIASFLIGSVPFGLIIAKIFYEKDITRLGSGNIGATNVTRVVGFWPAGAITFILDLMKGIGGVLLGSDAGVGILSSLLQVEPFDGGVGLTWVSGLAAIVGHCFSPWLRFNGGKGVATGFGAILMLSPWSALAGFLAFVLMFLFRRTGSLASLAGIAMASVTHLVIHPFNNHLWAGAALVFVILIRHESNIDALLENREKTF